METRPKTLFIDIDGVLLKHRGSLSNILLEWSVPPDGTLEKLHEWERKGYRLILTTGRKESMRDHTEFELNHLGIVYDQLIMGLGGGVRVLINDLKPDNPDQPTALAVNLPRDVGIAGVEL
jgi:hypothetical protein